jgi:hypothetical protein
MGRLVSSTLLPIPAASFVICFQPLSSLNCMSV